MLGTTVLGLCAGQADALVKNATPPTQIVQCAVLNDVASFELQFPGDINADSRRDLLVCGMDATGDIARVAGPAGTTTDPTTTEGGILRQ